MRKSDDRRRRRKKDLRLVFGLLAVWALVSFGFGIVLVEPLNTIRIGGFKLGFWFAQQGVIVVFIVLVLIYCLVKDRWDRRDGP